MASSIIYYLLSLQEISFQTLFQRQQFPVKIINLVLLKVSVSLLESAFSISNYFPTVSKSCSKFLPQQNKYINNIVVNILETY